MGNAYSISSATISYSGYRGKFWSVADNRRNYYAGKLIGIKDLVTFEGVTPTSAAHAFVEAVEDYIATKKSLNMKKKKPKSIKMDRRLVAGTQEHEVGYIAQRFAVPPAAVRKAIKSVGVSRPKIYNCLRAMGYTIITK